MVEEARHVPRAQQTWYLATYDSGNDMLQGPNGLRPVLWSDVTALAEAGLLRAVSENYASGNDYVISPQGHQYYAAIVQRQGEPLDRQENEFRRFLDSERFRHDHPAAYARWSEAERLLWAAESEREFTTIGHKCREAMQEFATEIVAKHQVDDADPDPTKVNRRLGAAIAKYRPSLGEKRAALLTALGNYSEATMGAIQRQEHGGQKEGHELTWDWSSPALVDT